MSLSVSPATEVPPPLCTWDIPRYPQEQRLELSAAAGASTVFVGANGSGKSALGLWLQRNSTGVSTSRLIAHRQLWLESAGPDITASSRQQQTTYRASLDARDDSRWFDHLAKTRTSLVLFDLIAAHNKRNDRVARLVDCGLPTDEIRKTVEPSPIARLNTILERAGLAVQVELTDTGSLDAVHAAGAHYPISEMSDGEKSALLLAAEVLMAERDSVQIIDEPERHMHRSISAPLVEAVVNERPDCHFAVLTHDLDLAYSLVQEGAAAVSLSNCSWNNGKTVAWDAELVPHDDALPNTVRAAILGGKRRVLFIEGTPTSIDFKLLRLLLPEWPLKPIGGCDEVTRAVKGLQASTDYNWIEAAGVVDRDQRSKDECEKLRQHGVFPLGVHEIENLYYTRPMLQRLAETQAPTLERDPDELLASARHAAFASLTEPASLDHVAGVVATAQIRHRLNEAAPTRTQVISEEDLLDIQVDNPFKAARQQLEQLVTDEDLDTIVKRYPIRDTPLQTAGGNRTRVPEDQPPAEYSTPSTDNRQRTARRTPTPCRASPHVGFTSRDTHPSYQLGRVHLKLH